jgi:hypothetical protein
MNAALTLALALGLLGQAPPTGEAKDERAARLSFMKKSLTNYTLHPAGNREARYRLQADPVLRFTNPVGTSLDGAIFLWLGGDDRPEAAAQVFLNPGDRWIHELASLSTGLLVAETRAGPTWEPSRAGVEFKPVPDAPRPAEAAEQRLRQMRALAQDFAVSDDFRNKGWQPLRPLARPFARYGRWGSPLADGGLFCFALGTDPEALLMLEARPGKDGPEWHYAFAPMTCYPLKVAWKGREVWNLPYRYHPAATEPFHNRQVEPEG